MSAGLGALYLALVLVVLLAAWLAYDKYFTDTTQVTLRTDAVGNALQKDSDVKVRGVNVGKVAEIRPTRDGADIVLDLDPQKASQIPADTTARLLPKTLFGERYVSLNLPDQATGTTLTSGTTIRQDTSTAAVELEQVFDQLLPLLTAVQPDKISATLSEIATALRGQGQDLGDTLSTTARYLTKLAPKVPGITRDLGKLASVARTYDAAVPDLLGALDQLTVTSKTFAASRAQLASVYATVASGSDATRGFVTPNQDTIIVLSQKGSKALAAVAPYSSEFPCTFRALQAFIPRMDKVLGKGTKQPGLHARLTVVPSQGKYVPGRDKPRYPQGGPSCPYSPGSGSSGGRSAPALATAEPPTAVGVDGRTGSAAVIRAQDSARTGLGKANSPAENQLIAELVGPSSGVAPQDFPGWGSLLLGPTMRGRTVSVS